MVIGDTLQLSALIAPEGVEFASARTTPTRSRSPPSRRRASRRTEPELEEETALVGEDGEAAEGEDAAEGEAEGDAGDGGDSERGVAPLRCSPPLGDGDGDASGDS